MSPKPGIDGIAGAGLDAGASSDVIRGVERLRADGLRGDFAPLDAAAAFLAMVFSLDVGRGAARTPTCMKRPKPAFRQGERRCATAGCGCREGAPPWLCRVRVDYAADARVDDRVFQQCAERMERKPLLFVTGRGVAVASIGVAIRPASAARLSLWCGSLDAVAARTIIRVPHV